MKALITILVLALIGWGIWWLVDRDDETIVNTSDNAGEVQGVDDEDVDLGDFQDKG